MAKLTMAGSEGPVRPSSDADPTSRHLWRWFLALEGVFALIYFPFGLPAQQALHLRRAPLDGVARTAVRVGLHRSVRRGRHRLRRVAQPPERPDRLVVPGRRRVPLHHRRHPLQVLAPDHGLSSPSPSPRSSTSSTSPCTRSSPSACCCSPGPGSREATGPASSTPSPSRSASACCRGSSSSGPTSGHPATVLVRLTVGRLPARRRPRPGHAGPPVERRRLPQHRRTPAGHRRPGHAGLRLALRPGQPPPGPQLERRQPGRPRMDPLLRLLGCGGAAPVDARAVRTQAGGGTADHPVPAGSAGRGLAHRPRRPARRGARSAIRSTPR